MSSDPKSTPRWPLHLQELSREIRHPRDASARDRARGEIWLLLNSALSRYLRAYVARLGTLPREDLEDIAAQKSLELLRRIETGRWRFGDRQPGEIAGFLARVAHNALADRLQNVRRRVLPEEPDRAEWDVRAAGHTPNCATTIAPDVATEGKEFAVALRRCAERLKPRARRVWLYRVFCDMSSKEIGLHPAVDLKPSYVDVVLQRCRAAIRDCMKEQGFQAHDMPPGTFVEMWRVFRIEWE